MRKYDKKNKMYMFIVLIASIILIVIFSFFINKAITNGKIHYDIDAGSIMYDKDKNLIKIDEDATLKIKWNDMYYLMYKEDMYLLGNNAIIYNPKKSQMNLYGKYYEVTSLGEDKVIVHEDETLVNTNESKFYKIADVFQMKMLHPGILLGIYITIAQDWMKLNNAEQALDILSQYTELAVSNIYPLHLHGDNFFDLLDEWLDSELVLRSFPPRDETLIRHSMTQALNENPVFLPLAKDSRFQMMVNRLKASEEEK